VAEAAETAVKRKKKPNIAKKKNGGKEMLGTKSTKWYSAL